MSKELEIVTRDISRKPCEIDINSVAGQIEETFNKLTAEGWRVNISRKIRIGLSCAEKPFELMERSTGGSGVTKFYEIVVYCHELHSYVDEFISKRTVRFIAPDAIPQDYYNIDQCHQFCAWRLHELGYDPNALAVGFWAEGGEFEFVGDSVPDPYDIWSAIEFALENKAIHPFNQAKTMGNLAKYLASNFPEDSIENIIGRIYEKSNDLFRDRGGKTFADDDKNKTWIANWTFEIGRLFERLIWKYRYEPVAALGLKAKTDLDSRTNASGKKSSDIRTQRIKALLSEIEELIETNPDIGLMGIKAISRLAAKKAKAKNEKLWGQGFGQIDQYLSDAKTSSEFSEQYQRIIEKTA